MVLSYDWSEGGDVEVVVEDIERLNMDYHDKYDKQQNDWRLLTEDGFASKRQLYTNGLKLRQQFADPFWQADKLVLSGAEGNEIAQIKLKLPGNTYLPGFNTILGDPDPIWNMKWSDVQTAWYKDVPYFVDNVTRTKSRSTRKGSGQAEKLRGCQIGTS